MHAGKVRQDSVALQSHRQHGRVATVNFAAWISENQTKLQPFKSALYLSAGAHAPNKYGRKQPQKASLPID